MASRHGMQVKVSWSQRHLSGSMYRALLFSGGSHPALAAGIADQLKVELDPVVLARSGNGELYARYPESVRGADVFLVQSCAPPTNDYLVELLIMAQAARLASARTITAVIPWYPYARQDRRAVEGEPLSARLVADLLAAARIDRAITIDLHVDQIQGFAPFPVDHLSAVPLLARHIRSVLGKDGRELVVVSADAGRIDTARRLASLLGGSAAVIIKERPAHQIARVSRLIGDVRGKACVLIDDMIDTGGTLCAAAEVVRDTGARRIWAAATHAVLSPPAAQRLSDGLFERIVVTDTLPIVATDAPTNLEAVSVAPMLATAIRAIVRPGADASA